MTRQIVLVVFFAALALQTLAAPTITLQKNTPVKAQTLGAPTITLQKNTPVKAAVLKPKAVVDKTSIAPASRGTRYGPTHHSNPTCSSFRCDHQWCCTGLICINTYCYRVL